MQSGIIESDNCHYNKSSPFHQYCWDFCTITFLPYSGSFSKYISTFINVPLTFKPGTEYAYSNMNFVLASYFVEKLSGLSFSQYIQKNILDIIPLENTFFDPWDGQFGVNQDRVDEYLLYKQSDDPFNNVAIGICRPYMNLGMMGGAGGMVSSNTDLHKWYTNLFNKSKAIPSVFKTKESRKALLYPYAKVTTGDKNDLYYTQGLIVRYDNISDISWPNEILYSGGTLCSTTAIRMVSNDTDSVIVSAFSNSPHAYLYPGVTMNELRYDIDKSVCEMGVDKLLYNNLSSVYFVMDNGLANDYANEMIKIWT